MTVPEATEVMMGERRGTERLSAVTLDAVREAEKLLRPIAYYEHQFAHIISLEERHLRVIKIYLSIHISVEKEKI